MNNKYKNQVKLLLDILPEVSKEACFALHGGTAINLFIRNMPRLSVDIDLTYLPLEDRETSLKNINEALTRIKAAITKNILNATAELKEKTGKLLISTKNASVKLEVSLMNRGSYAKPAIMALCEKAQEEFDAYCEIAVVPLGQLYGGKICAALDRQHPRDIFDIKYLLGTEGFSEEIKTGFLYCVLGAERPIHEILNPNMIDQKQAMVSQFDGMTGEDFSYEEYEDIKKKLADTVNAALNATDKNFLLSFKNLSPKWDTYPYGDFPSVRWKLENLEKLKKANPEKHANLFESLKTQLKVD
jgi:predicted nucleotidyltransferase component of viral defense system